MSIQPDLIKKLEVSSASGLIRLNGKFYVVADDDLNLISFTETETGFNRTKLFSGSLPEDPVARKKVKPDLEALTFISSLGAIMVLPSGSKPNRNTGALIHSGSVSNIDFSGLFAALSDKIENLNLEGIVEFENSIKLFQRGNAKGANNSIITLQTDQFVTELKTGMVTAKSLTGIQNCDLGHLNGVPLSFTDAAVWNSATGKKVVFLAAAEDTQTTYDDGEYRGAIFGVLNEAGDVIYEEEILSPQKPEGLWAENDVFYFVTDADDPSKKSELYRFQFNELSKNSRISSE